MEIPDRHSPALDALTDEFFLQDDLKQLVRDAGTLLAAPLLVLDDTYRVVASYSPLGFTDPLFLHTVAHGEISYEAGARLGEDPALFARRADYVTWEGSPLRYRLSTLFCSDVRLGYLFVADTDGHLPKIPEETFETIEKILAKQLFIETSRQDKPFETTEDLLMHLLDGGFSSASRFRLQAAGTYLSDFHPSCFALMDLSLYHSNYLGSRHLKEEVTARFPDAHPFIYRGDVFLFLHDEKAAAFFSELSEEFGVKVIFSAPIRDLFDLPALYRTAHDALMLLTEGDLLSRRVFSVGQLRTPLLLRTLSERTDLIPPELKNLAAHDSEKETQYCETLYYYLIFNRSLKKTCDALFTHRNTVLYRMDKIRGDFGISPDDSARYTEFLLGAAILLFCRHGAGFFLSPAPQATEESEPFSSL